MKDTEHDMNSKNEKKKVVLQWLKKNIAWVLLVIIILSGGFFGGQEYFSQKYEIHRLDSINKDHKKRESELQELIDQEAPYRDQIDEVIQQYEEQIEVEKQKRKYAEQRLNTIIDAIYPMRELDSFADNALFQ